MNHLNKAIAIALTVTGILVVNSVNDTALAGAGGEFQRFLDCKQLRQSGQLRWYSIATGIIDDGGGRNGYGGFHTKACHTSERSCRRWIQYIGREIPNLDTVHTAHCQRVR